MIFLSTLSLRRATNGRACAVFRRLNFYPRSPCGERHLTDLRHWQVGHFYPRSPCGERLKTPCVKLSIDVFLSTLSLRRATKNVSGQELYYTISIHALLAESDTSNVVIRDSTYISIHALLAESDPAKCTIWVCLKKFLSTLSLRRATHVKCRNTRQHIYFYPRSPCGERLSM